jgi:hypothetical protein
MNLLRRGDHRKALMVALLFMIDQEDGGTKGSSGVGLRRMSSDAV